MSDTLTTYGWDTAFAIRLRDVNSAIVKARSSPRSFAFAPDSYSHLNGTFGDWQVRRGPTGDLIHLTVPITGGTLSWLENTWPLAGITAIIEVRLETIAGEVQSGSTRWDLRVKPTGMPAYHELPSEPPASLVDVIYPDHALDGDGDAFLREALPIYFQNHLAEFDHIFASVNINEMEDTGDWAWLAPSFVSYAFVSGSSDDASHLGVLCLTQSEPVANRLCELAPSAIPDGSLSGFLIGTHLLMKNIIRPALVRAFPGTSDSDFVLSKDEQRITLARSLDMPPHDYEGTTYQSKLDELTVSITGSALTLESESSVELSDGIHGHVRNTHFANVIITTLPDGKQTLSFDTSLSPILGNPWTTKDGAITVIEILVGVLAGFAAVAVTMLTAGTATLIALVVVGLVFGIAEAAPSIVAAALEGRTTDEMASVDGLLLTGVKPINWPDSTDYRLTAATLNGCLQLGGDPQFAH